MSVVNKLEEFFNNGPALITAKVLRDGANIEFKIDNDMYTLEKIEGKIKVKPGAKNCDVTFSMNKSAFEYVFAANSWEELMRRVQKISFFPTEEKNGNLRINMTDDQIADYSWRGYHYWARRMGFGL